MPEISKTPSAHGKRSKLIYRICLTAMFLAFAVVVKLLLPINISLFGAGGMKISFAGVFTAFPAILFGPLYGGAASALSDILGYLIKPDGAYIPWLSLTAFLGGCIKGFLWMLLTKRKSVGLRAATAALLVVLGVFGGATHVSLIGDGVMTGFVTAQSDLPTKGAVTSTELSPLSSIACELAKYNNDTFTLISAPDSKELTVPASVSLDGYESKLTKIGAKAFSGCASLERIFIPSNITSVDAAAFEGLDPAKLTIVTPEGSKAASFAEASSIKCETGEPESATAVLAADSLSDGNFTFKSSDTYRKYLSGYINFQTLGLELISLAGLVLLAVDLLIKKRGEKSASGNFLKIFVTIAASGLTVTTINTEILKYFLAAWNGREFMILWIPRAVEELIVCMFQAYVISLLYGVYAARIAAKKDIAGKVNTEK